MDMNYKMVQEQFPGIDDHGKLMFLDCLDLIADAVSDARFIRKEEIMETFANLWKAAAKVGYERGYVDGEYQTLKEMSYTQKVYDVEVTVVEVAK